MFSSRELGKADVAGYVYNLNNNDITLAYVTTRANVEKILSLEKRRIFQVVDIT